MSTNRKIFSEGGQRSEEERVTDLGSDGRWVIREACPEEVIFDLRLGCQESYLLNISLGE